MVKSPAEVEAPVRGRPDLGSRDGGRASTPWPAGCARDRDGGGRRARDPRGRRRPELHDGGRRRAADSAWNLPSRRPADAGGRSSRARLRGPRPRLPRRHVPYGRRRRAAGGPRAGARGGRRRCGGRRSTRPGPGRQSEACGRRRAAPSSPAAWAEAWWGEFMPHGAGTGQHEPPYGDRDPRCVLREGMVLCIEPGALFPGSPAWCTSRWSRSLETGRRC